MMQNPYEHLFIIPSGFLLNLHLPIIDKSSRELPELLTATAKHDVARVRELLRLGADANQVNRRNQTALHLAAAATTEESAGSQVEMIELLIQHGADVNALDTRRHTPLCMTMPRPQRPAHADVIVLLLKSGARIDSIRDPDDISPIYLTLFYGYSKVLRALFKYNIHAAVEATSYVMTQHASPMHCAAHYTQPECFKILVENGFDPNLQIGSGLMTPVHMCIRSADYDHKHHRDLDKYMKTLRVMLEVNVNFEISCRGQDFDGKAHAETTTPFEYALHYDMFDVAHFLANVVGVNIQSIRRICRTRGIQAMPLEDEQIVERQPGESVERVELLTLLRKAASPWSLCSLCRSVVRRSLGRRIKDVNELDIPDTLKHYIMFNYDYAS